jgi:hypothetical protein
MPKQDGLTLFYSWKTKFVKFNSLFVETVFFVILLSIMLVILVT